MYQGRLHGTFETPFGINTALYNDNNMVITNN